VADVVGDVRRSGQKDAASNLAVDCGTVKLGESRLHQFLSVLSATLVEGWRTLPSRSVPNH